MRLTGYEEEPEPQFDDDDCYAIDDAMLNAENVGLHDCEDYERPDTQQNNVPTMADYANRLLAAMGGRR